MLKTVSSITNAIGALNYVGTWNASTNSPTITSSAGVKGDYYVVSVAGSTSINGISNWGVGDWIAFNGSVWQRVEGGADVNAVNITASGTANITGSISTSTSVTASNGTAGGDVKAQNTKASTSALPTPSGKILLVGQSWNSANGDTTRTGFIRSNTALNNANPTIESITIAPDNGAGGQNEAFAFCGNGRFGIGTPAPAYALQVSTDSAAKPSTNTWTIASDARIKNILGDYEKGLDEICQLRPIRYTYNNKAGFPESLGDQVSIIAQDAMIPFPECVGTFSGKLEETDTEETELYNWNGHAVTFALINSVKQLRQMVESLQQEIASLKQTSV